MVRTILTDWKLGNREPIQSFRSYKRKSSVRAFIQARCADSEHLRDESCGRISSRIYEDLNGAPVLFHTIDALASCKMVDEVIVISPSPLPSLPEGIKEHCIPDADNDVLLRYHEALKAYPSDYIVRVTSDCPLLDPYLVDYIVAHTIGGFQYGSNVLTSTFPDGMDIEVISSDTINRLHEEIKDPYYRQHVTLAIRNDPHLQARMQLLSVQAIEDQSYIKLSIDTDDGLDVIREYENRMGRIVS